MGFWFSWKDTSGRWAKPEQSESATEGQRKAYERRGRRRGGWITADDDHKQDLENHIDDENSRLDWDENS